MANQTTNLIIHLPDAATTTQVPVADYSRATPDLLLQYLVREGALPPPSAERPYQVRAGGIDLVPTQSLESQGIEPGAELFVQREGTGACAPEEIR